MSKLLLRIPKAKWGVRPFLFPNLRNGKFSPSDSALVMGRSSQFCEFTDEQAVYVH